MGERITTHRQLRVYTRAFAAAMQFFHLSKRFPKEETYSLTDQGRRSSRSVCANITEAWRKRRYPAAFVSKLSDAETEAAETQVWIEFAVARGYLEAAMAHTLKEEYDGIIGTLVGMINHPETWVLPQRS